MQYRNFGSTPLRVSEIGFGCARIGGIFSAGKGSAGETIRVLNKAVNEGINFFDTADMYSQGESEALLGRAFRDRRDKVIIAGKAGYCLPAQRKFIARVKPLVKPLIKVLGIKRDSLPSAVTGSISQDFSPQYLANALEASLKRLNTDYLDIFQLHSPPPEIINRGDFLATLETLENLKSQGKIRYYGVAADSVEDARLALKYPGISSLEFPFGLLDQEALDSLLSEASQQGVGLIARGCFGGGLLKADLTEDRLREATPKWPQVMAFRALAGRQGRELLEAALKFVLHVDSVSVALLGMRTENHLADSLRFFSAPPLSDEEYHDYTGAKVMA